MDINQVVDKLSNLVFAIDSFQYSFESLGKKSFFSKPKKHISLHYNSFLPVITVNVAESNTKTVVEMNFKPIPIVRFMLIGFSSFAILLEIFILFELFQYTHIDIIPLFLPFGISAFSILLSSIALRGFSWVAKQKIIKSLE